MRPLDPAPAGATDARREGSDHIARHPDDVTEWRSSRAEFFGLVANDRRDWRRRVSRASIWIIAGTVSLLGNAEVFMLLAHRDLGDTAVGPADPAVVMIDLPAPAIAPAASARPDATAETSPEIAQDASADQSASREPDAPAPPDAATPPDAAAPTVVQPPPTPVSPVEVPRSAQASEPWNAAPAPVLRPRGRRRAAGARLAIGPTSQNRSANAAVILSARADAARRAARMASASAFSGSSSSTADWKSQVVASLNRAKHYPDGTDAVGSPTIRMMVAASGDVARVAIVASSGSSALDSAALDTVRRVSPLPPPPGGETGLTFRMNFHLRSP